MSTKKTTDRYKEAVHYLENAKDILRTKANKKDDFYQDTKYVSMACGTAYKGVLMLIDAWLEMKGKPIRVKNNRPNVDDYRRALGTDRKMLNYFNGTWETLHCAGYYDAYPGVKLISAGMSYAEDIFNVIGPLVNAKDKAK